MPVLPTTPAAVTAVAGAAVQNTSDGGIITSEALTTAAAATYTCTVGCDAILGPTSIVLASIQNGTNTAGDPSLSTVAVTLGKVVFVVTNRHASAALNGTIKISFVVFN